MFDAPSKVELAGCASHQTALLLSMVVAVIDALVTVAGTSFIDRLGRRRLAIGNLIRVIGALEVLPVGLLGSRSSAKLLPSSRLHFPPSIISPLPLSTVFPASRLVPCADPENEGQYHTLSCLPF
ncbi:hypothetical protein Mapa_005801 [Marchantia paleacea]|nr:hypothetical protein Mapa_005801 [Marchantia paleacea]